MLQRFLSHWRNGFGLDQKSFRIWLANLALLLLIGWFALANDAEGTTYAFAVFLVVANSLIMFLLQRDVARIKVATLTFLTVLNVILFGYYYFSSISFF